MFWNHRIVKRIVNGEEIYGIHEVFYTENRDIHAITENPIEIEANSIEELKMVMQQINDCMDKPILVESEIEYKPFGEDKNADE